MWQKCYQKHGNVEEKGHPKTESSLNEIRTACLGFTHDTDSRMKLNV